MKRLLKAFALMLAAGSYPAHASGTEGSAFGFSFGGEFELTNQLGQKRTQVDPKGQMQLLFFGYANCQAICSVALPLMGQAVDDLLAKDLSVTPVMITVDPKRDTVDNIGAPLQEYHKDFVGLTGHPDKLQVAYDLFSVENTVVFTDPFDGDIFAHGSHIYLLDSNGKFLTLLPPILSSERVVELVEKYANQ